MVPARVWGQRKKWDYQSLNDARDGYASRTSVLMSVEGVVLESSSDSAGDALVLCD